MPDPIVFPDAVAAVLAYLADVLAVDTGTHPPKDRTVGDGPLIVARRTGGTADEIVVDLATFVLESWHDTEEEAHDLAQLARAYVLALWNTNVDGTLLYRAVELGGPASLPDPLQRSPRFTATYQVAARGSTLVESS